MKVAHVLFEGRRTPIEELKRTEVVLGRKLRALSILKDETRRNETSAVGSYLNRTGAYKLLYSSTGDLKGVPSSIIGIVSNPSLLDVTLDKLRLWVANDYRRIKKATTSQSTRGSI